MRGIQKNLLLKMIGPVSVTYEEGTPAGRRGQGTATQFNPRRVKKQLRGGIGKSR